MWRSPCLSLDHLSAQFKMRCSSLQLHGCEALIPDLSSTAAGGQACTNSVSPQPVQMMISCCSTTWTESKPCFTARLHRYLSWQVEAWSLRRQFVSVSSLK